VNPNSTPSEGLYGRESHKQRGNAPDSTDDANGAQAGTEGFGAPEIHHWDAAKTTEVAQLLAEHPPRAQWTTTNADQPPAARDWCLDNPPLTVALGYPVRCPHCPANAGPVPPTHWTKHLQRHHPEASMSAPIPAEHCGNVVNRPVGGGVTECVLRPGHTGSHADQTGMRWMETPVCCVCGGGPVTYRNYRDQPFCAHCANCQCAENPCIRTGVEDPEVSAPAALRDQIAAAIYERNNPGHRWADAHPDDRLAYGGDADAAMQVRDTEMERLKLLVAASSEDGHAVRTAARNAAALDRVRDACAQLQAAALNADGQPLTLRDDGICQAVRRVLAALDLQEQQ
jgi:hypothetical protein